MSDEPLIRPADFRNMSDAQLQTEVERLWKQLESEPGGFNPPAGAPFNQTRQNFNSAIYILDKRRGFTSPWESDIEAMRAWIATPWQKG